MRPRTTGQVALPTVLVQAYREVTVASIADALWEQGISAHLPHQIKPIFPAKIVGPAVTVLEAPTSEKVPPQHALELTDGYEPGSVIVIAIGGFADVAVWGGLMTAGSAANGLEGAVLDGDVRDTRRHAAPSGPLRRGHRHYRGR